MPPIMDCTAGSDASDHGNRISNNKEGQGIFLFSSTANISQVLPRSRSVHLCVRAAMGPSHMKNVSASTDTVLSTPNAPQRSSQGRCLGEKGQISGVRDLQTGELFSVR